MIRIATTGLLLACGGCAAEPAANQAIENYIMDNVPAAEPVNDSNGIEWVVSNITAPVDTAGLPADVTAFLERRQGCEHFAGEPDWGDAARKKDLDAAVAEICPGIDTQLATLRKRHAGDAKAIAALVEFEPLGIE